MYMIDVYITLIVRGSRNITKVPLSLQPYVLKGLSELGLDGYGLPIEEAI